MPELFTFGEHTDVSPDNSAGERAIRPSVIARKVSGGTRSAHGSKTRATLMSLFATWQAHGRDVLSACQEMLSGRPRRQKRQPDNFMLPERELLPIT